MIHRYKWQLFFIVWGAFGNATGVGWLNLFPVPGIYVSVAPRSISSWGEGGSNILTCPQRLMDLFEFQNPLRDFPSNMGGRSEDALASMWNREGALAIDTIASRCQWPAFGAQGAPWFTLEFRDMKQLVRKLEGYWWKSKSEPDQTLTRAHAWVYAVAVEVARQRRMTLLLLLTQRSNIQHAFVI